MGMEGADGGWGWCNHILNVHIPWQGGMGGGGGGFLKIFEIFFFFFFSIFYGL